MNTNNPKKITSGAFWRNVWNELKPALPGIIAAAFVGELAKMLVDSATRKRTETIDCNGIDVEYTV